MYYVVMPSFVLSNILLVVTCRLFHLTTACRFVSRFRSHRVCIVRSFVLCD